MSMLVKDTKLLSRIEAAGIYTHDECERLAMGATLSDKHGNYYHYNNDKDAIYVTAGPANGEVITCGPGNTITVTKKSYQVATDLGLWSGSSIYAYEPVGRIAAQMVKSPEIHCKHCGKLTAKLLIDGTYKREWIAMKSPDINWCASCYVFERNE